VSGTVYDEKGKKVTELKGKWSDNLAIQKDSDNYKTLWECNEMPKDTEDYYGFTYFAMSLNELTKDLDGVLPPTDTRLRPDQRAFEEGDVDKAEELKHKLEDAQRAKRKDGKSPKPRWFHKVEGEEPEWQYGGENGTTYFRSRAKVTGNEDGFGADEDAKEPGGTGKDAWEDVPTIFEVE
jgi:chaperonin cofactor prefoldin